MIYNFFFFLNTLVLTMLLDTIHLHSWVPVVWENWGQDNIPFLPLLPSPPVNNSYTNISTTWEAPSVAQTVLKLFVRYDVYHLFNTQCQSLRKKSLKIMSIDRGSYSESSTNLVVLPEAKGNVNSFRAILLFMQGSVYQTENEKELLPMQGLKDHV